MDILSPLPNTLDFHLTKTKTRNSPFFPQIPFVSLSLAYIVHTPPSLPKSTTSLAGLLLRRHPLPLSLLSAGLIRLSLFSYTYIIIQKYCFFPSSILTYECPFKHVLIFLIFRCIYILGIVRAERHIEINKS